MRTVAGVSSQVEVRSRRQSKQTWGAEFSAFIGVNQIANRAGSPYVLGGGGTSWSSDDAGVGLGSSPPPCGTARIVDCARVANV